MPRLPGGYLLAGKAQVAQSKQLAAAADFKRALAIDSNSLRHPEDLHAYARLQTLLGHHKRALKLYRRLIPQTNLLSAPNARSLVLLQAAHLLIRLAEQNPKEKSARHNEALNYLRAAQRGQQSQGFRRDIALSLVVLLDDGKKGVPSALLSDELGLRAWARRSERAHAYASPWAALAMKALALEGLAPKSALRHWRKLRQRDDLPRDRLAWVDARVQILQKKRRRRR